MRALRIRQPWAELILLRLKRVEARSRRTTKVGERVFVCAGLQRIEPEEESRLAEEFGIDIDSLPRGVLVGTVEIVRYESLKPGHSQVACFEITEATDKFAWLLNHPQRADILRKPDKHPQPSFFSPY